MPTCHMQPLHAEPWQDGDCQHCSWWVARCQGDPHLALAAGSAVRALPSRLLGPNIIWRAAHKLTINGSM